MKSKVMKNLPIEKQNKLKKIAQKRLRLLDEYRITPWLYKLPIWSFVSKSPVTNGMIISLGLLSAVFLTNLGSLDYHFILKQFILAIEVWIGFYAAHYFAEISNQMYAHLKLITLLPHDTFKRWFAEKASIPWGKINLLAIQDRGKYSLLDVYKRDKAIFVWFFSANISISLLLCFLLDLPRLSWSPGCILQYIFVIFWCYTWVWTMHWVVHGIGFLLNLAKLPVRFFFGIPDNQTLKSIGNLVVKFNFVSTLHFILLLSMLYFWDVIPNREMGDNHSGSMVVIALLGGLLIYIIWGCIMGPIVSQIALSSTMRSYKKRLMAEFSYHLEECFNGFMKNPSHENHVLLIENNKKLKLLKKLPSIGITPGYFLINILLVSLDFFALMLYMKLSFGGWMFF